MPEKMAFLLDMIGVDPSEEKRSFAAATYGFDRDYGTPRIELGRGRKGVLFPMLSSET